MYCVMVDLWFVMRTWPDLVPLRLQNQIFAECQCKRYQTKWRVVQITCALVSVYVRMYGVCVSIVTAERYHGEMSLATATRKNVHSNGNTCKWAKLHAPHVNMTSCKHDVPHVFFGSVDVTFCRRCGVWTILAEKWNHVSFSPLMHTTRVKMNICDASLWQIPHLSLSEQFNKRQIQLLSTTYLFVFKVRSRMPK